MNVAYAVLRHRQLNPKSFRLHGSHPEVFSRALVLQFETNHSDKHQPRVWPRLQPYQFTTHIAGLRWLRLTLWLTVY